MTDEPSATATGLPCAAGVAILHSDSLLIGSYTLCRFSLILFYTSCTSWSWWCLRISRRDILYTL